MFLWSFCTENDSFWASFCTKFFYITMAFQSWASADQKILQGVCDFLHNRRKQSSFITDKTVHASLSYYKYRTMAEILHVLKHGWNQLLGYITALVYTVNSWVYWILEQTCTDTGRISLAYRGRWMQKKLAKNKQICECVENLPYTESWNIYSCLSVFVVTLSVTLLPLGLFAALTQILLNRSQTSYPVWLICNGQNSPLCVTGHKTKPVSRRWDVSCPGEKRYCLRQLD